jgi:two-component system, LuxR family, sensor kinase FixL
MRVESPVEKVRHGLHVVQDTVAGEFKFRRLLEKLPAGAYTCDAEGLITYFNPHAAALWGRSPKLNHPDDRFCGSFKLFSVDGAPIEHRHCWMALALEGRREYNGREIVIERPDGQRVIALAHANPYLDDSGNLLGAVNVLIDISARKRAEELLRESHDRLAHKVIERTVELTELSHHLMQVAEDERAKLAAELHDEMGSLLTVLSMRLNRFRERLTGVAPKLVSEQQELIELVRNMVSSQRRLVESLRPVLLDSFGLGVALTHHAEDWSKNTGIKVVTSVAADLPSLPADVALALFRITQESLTNVAKYADADQVRITASATDGHVTVCVEDDGVGISQTEAQGATSHGILGMRERLLRFGGELSIGNGEGERGTRVRAVVPVLRRND